MKKLSNIEKKDKIQKQAIKAWIDCGKQGTLEMITGIGKTFCALHALYTMPKNDGKIHLFLAEVTDRENDLHKDILKYNQIFNRNVLKDYDLEFYCYQTVYKWKNKSFGLVIADELHDSLSSSYSKFYFNNKYDAIIGLSATINKTITYTDDNGKYYTKGDLLNQIAPICFKYNLKQAKEDKTTRKLKITVIKTKLDNTNKYIVAGNARKRFYQTEVAAYSYWDKEFKKSININEFNEFGILDNDKVEEKNRKIMITSSKRKNIIYNSLEKIQVCKILLSKINSKTIVFGNSLDSLLKVTKNVVSSRNKDEVNDKIKDLFNNNKIKEIGSFKKLKQGTNLSGLDVVILMSYYGTSLDWIQRIGRLRDDGTIGNVIILLTEESQEITWFNNMLQESGDLDITYYNNINEYINERYNI